MTNKFDDLINHPSHYQSENGIQCIDAIQSALTPEEFEGYLKGNVMKYLWRASKKGAKLDDYQKARWYQDKLVDVEVTKTSQRVMDNVDHIRSCAAPPKSPSPKTTTLVH